MTRYVVVALFDALEVGTSFSRRRWPAHVTLVSNFVTAAPLNEIVAALQRAVAVDYPIDIVLDGLDLFGPRRDIPVRLVRSKRIVSLHGEMLDELASLPDIEADTPTHWREGYRPHLTLGPAIDTAEGERRTVRSIALARLDGGTATLVATVEVEDPRPERGEM